MMREHAPANGREARQSPLARAASTAPAAPGVYFLLNRKRELVYVGMAKDLRRRLRQHANAPRDALYRRVADVLWEETADEDAAAAREADLIVALQPPYNAAIAGAGKWAYIHVAAHTERGPARFTLEKDIGAADGARTYGCFPHLGAGVGSLPGIACSDGYAAFLRLLWAAMGEGTHFPGRITRGTPPEDFTVPLDPDDLPALHGFLSGTSRRLLPSLSMRAMQRPAFMRAGIARDYRLAEAFFAHGPRVLRRLRLRHGFGAGPVGQERIERALRREVEDLLARQAEAQRRREPDDGAGPSPERQAGRAGCPDGAAAASPRSRARRLRNPRFPLPGR
jgi:predicted GIY-YIG superfamily endonuclease